ncbi:MAG TPA: alternative ribosome rescue aminoacyl-tRNA hydrolase ArfB [Stellaceae bacterium]|jgi:ribosome-associated protein|nr:alternative ribosome rescue aminoacyl-tRNA hydrolase ArfB [Stellaceae bacterium]
MLRITPSLSIDESEITFEFVTASGPGGQNVNKVASAAQLRFDAVHCAALSPALLSRLATLAGRRMTKDGVIVIQAQRFRSQEQNRRDALDRLIALIASAAVAPKARRKTRPTQAAKERRLTAKRHRSERKRTRRPGED